MMNPEHPSNDDDAIELTEVTPEDGQPEALTRPFIEREQLEPMRAENPVVPGKMVEPIAVSMLSPGELFVVEHSPERVVSKKKPVDAGEKPVLGMSPEKVEEVKRYGNGM